MKRSIFFVFIMVGLGSSIFSQVNPVKFWTALPEPEHSVMAQLVEQYNEEHSSHPVSYENFPSSQTLFDALKETKLPPELALIDSDWIGSLKDKLVPADEILAKAGAMVKAVAKADTFKPIWDTCVIENKAYAIPYSAETAALVLNLHYFKMSSERLRKKSRYFKKPVKIGTVKQLEKVALKLQKGPVKGLPLVLPFSWNNGELAKLWLNFLGAMGKKAPFTVNDIAAGLTIWWDWINQTHISTLNVPKFPEKFIFGAAWVLLPRDVELLKEKVFVQTLPRDKKPWTYLHVKALAFLGGDRGWDFANYLTDYPQIKAWSMRTPTVPVNKQVYLSPDYLHDVDSRRPWMRTYIAAISQAPVSFSFSPEQLRLIGQALERGLKKDLMIRDAAARIHGSF